MKEKSNNPNSNYVWYRDRATFIALITGSFSTVITLINALTR